MGLTFARGVISHATRARDEDVTRESEREGAAADKGKREVYSGSFRGASVPEGGILERRVRERMSRILARLRGSFRSGSGRVM